MVSALPSPQVVFFSWDRRRPRLHSRIAPRETVLIIHLTISWTHSARLCAQGKYMQAGTPALPGKGVSAPWDSAVNLIENFYFIERGLRGQGAV